jgi:hypothetical protein
MDQVLTNVMIYLVTDTIGTSMWMYRSNADEIADAQGKATMPPAQRRVQRRLSL